MMRERKKINAKFFEKKKCNDYKFFTCKNQNINYCNDYKIKQTLKLNNKTERKQNNEND